MGRRMPGMDLRAAVERLAARGGDLTDVRRELDVLLRAAVGYDVAALSTVDPATNLWTSCFLTGLPVDGGAARERVIFGIEFTGGDPNAYGELANAPTPIGRLHAVTGGDLTTARRYHEVLAPLGITDELRAMLRSAGGCWGSLTLYRMADRAPFDDAEEATLAAALGAIADLFRLTMLRAALGSPHAVEAPPGMLLVDREGDVTTASDAARAWLELLDDRGRVPSAVRTVAAAVATGSQPVARAALPAPDGGWVVLHASPAGEQVAVIVEGARPSALADVIAGAYGFTPREREVTALAAQGRTTKQMAAALGISPFTVQDHLKAVFAKTGAQTRGELVATLFSTHYQPRRDVGSTPGPYGWYLDDAIAPLASA